MRKPDGSAFEMMVHLSEVIDQPNFQVGEFSYATDFDPPENWAQRLAPYLFPGSSERLIIGRFGQFAHGTRFITASANHWMGGVSTYPFSVMDPARIAGHLAMLGQLPDTVIGHDVWTGHGAMIMPGARIGNGVIVGAGSVVRGTVPDFAVVIGNPARVVRMRFSDDVIARLQRLAWWDWPIEAIEDNVGLLEAQDIDALEAAGARL